MGIDYLCCKNCGDAFPDVMDYVSCECGEDWCSYECASEDGYHNEWCNKYDCHIDNSDCVDCSEECEYYEDASCKYCRYEDFDDSELLEFALTQLGKSRNDLMELYKESKGV